MLVSLGMCYVHSRNGHLHWSIHHCHMLRTSIKPTPFELLGEAIAQHLIKQYWTLEAQTCKMLRAIKNSGQYNNSIAALQQFNQH